MSALKLVFAIIFFAQSGLAFANSNAITRIPANAENIKHLQAEGVLIVDIRKEWEWRATGVIPNAVQLTFLQPSRRAIAPLFAEKFPEIAPKNKPVAIICNTQSRTTALANLLAENGWTHVIQLTGGAESLVRQGYTFAPYHRSY